jgi:hypothetical protein
MIAISYRRDDSLSVTGCLYDRLETQFGKASLFMDFDSIPAGLDFRTQIAQVIDRTQLVIAVIGPRWQGERGDGSRRIDDPEDFVRLEIARALQRDIPVIPLLLDGAVMPGPDTLPADIKQLAFRHALPLNSGIDFHNHADRLIARILEIIPNNSAGPSRALRLRGRARGITVSILLVSAVSLWLVLKNRTEQRPRSVSGPAPFDVTVERYAQLTGTWVIFEQVRKDHGGEEIVWNYDASVTGRQVTMRGKKTVVNEPGLTTKRELAPDERLTTSTYLLTLKGLDAEGTSDEQDPNGHLYSTLKIRFSDDLRSLSGTLKTGGAEISSLYGSKQ